MLMPIPIGPPCQEVGVFYCVDCREPACCSAHANEGCGDGPPVWEYREPPELDDMPVIMPTQGGKGVSVQRITI